MDFAAAEKRNKNDVEIAFSGWASWGAAVLRPYMIEARICGGDVASTSCESLRDDWVWFFGVDAEFLDGFVEDLGVEFAVEVKLVQRG